MSQDYPDYLVIREKSRLLGWFWMIGDRGYYLGLLGAILALSGGVVGLLFGGLSLIWPDNQSLLRQCDRLLGWIHSFPIFAGIFFVAICLKRFARRRAGIPEVPRDI